MVTGVGSKEADGSTGPPEKFDFTRPDAWPKWKKRFESYRIASGLDKKDGAVQVSTFIYSMGPEAEDILSSLTLSDEDKKTYQPVIGSFESHFVQRLNPIYERARFNQRKQEQGETVDSFLTALHSLAEYCQYGNMKEEMIRERLVVGLLDASLFVKLQLQADLTLTSAVKRARNSEAVKLQQSVVRAAPHVTETHTAVSADAVQSQRPRHGKPNPQRQQGGKDREHITIGSPSQPSQRKCRWCGYDQHHRSK